MHDRTVLALTGADRVSFLQGLVTNDIEKAQDQLVYTALLTPQGKFIADFFALSEPDQLLLDASTAIAPQLMQRLSMYRLRADVDINETELVVSRGTGAPPAGAFADPRHPALGWRSFGTTDQSDDTDWDQLRVTHMIPETGIELSPDSYILEMGFEALGGVDFKKGCYVGQEIVARMKHKTELKKGLARVKISGTAAPGDEITVEGKPAGTLHTISVDEGLAYLRFDRASGPMRAGNATLIRID